MNVLLPITEKQVMNAKTIKFPYEYNAYTGELSIGLNGLLVGNDGCFLGELEGLGIFGIKIKIGIPGFIKKIGRGVKKVVKGTINAAINVGKKALKVTKKAREALWKYTGMEFLTKTIPQKAWKHRRGLLQIGAVAALVAVAVVAAPALVGAAGAIGNAAASAGIAIGKGAVAAGKFALTAGKFAIKNWKTIDKINTVREGAQSLMQQHPELSQQEAEQIMTQTAQVTQEAVAHPEQFKAPPILVESKSLQHRKAGFSIVGIGIVSLLLVAGIAVPMLIKRR